MFSLLFTTQYVGWIIGALIGIILDRLYDSFIKKHMKQIYLQISRKRRHYLYNNVKVKEWVERYYRNKQLFECSFGKQKTRIPFLTTNSWYGFSKDVFATDIIQVCEDKMTFPINRRMIKHRERIGQRLFNDPSLFFKRIGKGHCFITQECCFFEKLTFINSIEKETYICSKNKYIKPKKREKFFKNFDIALEEKNQPMSMGCHVAFIINYKGEKMVAINKRSESTFTYGGSYALVPVFGLCPIPNNTKSNILLYNIIKEYCEEMFNKSILERRSSSHADPLWFYREFPEAVELLDGLKEQRVFCKYLGFGVDAINGMGIIASMIYVKDNVLSEKIFHNCAANWEVEDQNYGEGIHFVKLNDQSIMSNVEKGLFQGGSAFALSLSISEIKKGEYQ